MIKIMALTAMALAAIPAAEPTSGQVEQIRFESPQAAVDAFVAACEANSTANLIGIFGPLYAAEAEQISDSEERANRAKIVDMAREIRRLETHSPEKVVLVLGKQLWPFPIPLVREETGWRFDTDEGLDEIRKRRIGQNELTAIDVCRTYVDAQLEYAYEDRDGDGALEYAQKIRSGDGKTDGLYWDAGSGERLSPLGPMLAAVDESVERKEAEGYVGYRYKILTGQGRHAVNGKGSYVVGDDMTEGFALIAWPVDYGRSGIMTFIVNHLGAVYQADLGAKTSKKAQKIKSFEPDGSWTLVTD